MAGEIGLVGGNEFRQHCKDMDREIMRASGQNPARVLIIPTAAVAGPTKAAEDGVRHFASLGGNASRLMVLDKRHAEDTAFIRGIAGAGLIYFTGGSPYHLLDTLRNSKLLEAIRSAVNNGALLAGSSAGAMVLGSLMGRPASGEWVEALGIVPRVAIWPHHESRDPAETSRQLQRQVPSDLTILGIDAQTGCLGRPGNWRVVGFGKVTVYRGDQWTVYRSGERLPADV
jgi:cyanophycinase